MKKKKAENKGAGMRDEEPLLPDPALTLTEVLNAREKANYCHKYVIAEIILFR